MDLVVISASRRTDIPAFYLHWLAEGVKQEKVRVVGPGGRVYNVSLKPERVHTFVLWSKNFLPFIRNQHNILQLMRKYTQLYFLFTITGLGGTIWEERVLPAERAVEQLDRLVEIAGSPLRVSVRFDPVVFWWEWGKLRTNLYFFEKLAPELEKRGIRDVRFSFVEWYPKVVRRVQKRGIEFYDPPLEEKIRHVRYLASVASSHSLQLHACAQPPELLVDGVKKSACIDGVLLSQLHPLGWKAPTFKDPSQRPACGCSKSIDIGSYTLVCRHRCLYCYANPSR